MLEKIWQRLSIPRRIKGQSYHMLYLKAEKFHTTLKQNFWIYVHINENMKWNNHIKYLSSKLNTSYYMISFLKNVMSPYVIWTMYCACLHVHLRYGLTPWGGDPERIKVFKLRKKVVRIIGKVGQHFSCRNLFKDLNILPLHLSVYKWDCVLCTIKFGKDDL
jgi:hypothetical protein